AEPRWEEVQARKFAVPHTVRQAIGRRLARLPDDSQRLLQIASVIGREFDLPTLEAVWRASGVGGAGLRPARGGLGEDPSLALSPPVILSERGTEGDAALVRQPLGFVPPAAAPTKKRSAALAPVTTTGSRPSSVPAGLTREVLLKAIDAAVGARVVED